jgi:DNA invertase Pin-like site-specific DNA recombinase
VRRSANSGLVSGASAVAAQYIRMSTELQQYSPENQKRAIAEFAATRNIKIVATYEDAGKSGVSLRSRPALARLLSDVQNQEYRFNYVLVYDVSRWGRFLDVDESAHYEFLCRRAGVNVVYCGESFANDGSSASNIIKTVKRAMAGEYSRELSKKVYAGQRRLAELGFWQGASPGYGLRRMLIAADGRVKGPLQFSERKSIQNDRVILVPGPDHEVALVRRIYEWYVEDGVSAERITDRLNSIGLFNERNVRWTPSAIERILTSETYAGTNVYGRTSCKLGECWRLKYPSDWVRAVNAFQPVVDHVIFEAAQARRYTRTGLVPDDELLDRLACLAQKRGEVNTRLIDVDNTTPSAQTYARRFGSLRNAYRAIGYEPRPLDRFAATYRAARIALDACIQRVTAALEDDGRQLMYGPDGTLISVDEELQIKFVVRIVHHPADRSTPWWQVTWPVRCRPDLLVAVCLDLASHSEPETYVIPRGYMSCGQSVKLHYRSGSHFDLNAFRFPDPGILVDLTARSPLEVLHGIIKARPDT